MIKAPIPPTETSRLGALHALKALDTAPEERFDRVTRLAQRLFDVPIALVSLVDSARAWFKSHQGISADQVPREISFCGHAILDDRPLVVPDALLDPRFSDNPLVTGEPLVRFYAGHPLHGPDGSRLGTLCVVDRRPREMGRTDLRLLADLAALVEVELASVPLNDALDRHRRAEAELKRLAITDGLTGLFNRRYLAERLAQEAARSDRYGSRACALMIDIDHFKRVNDTYGHETGDTVLGRVAQAIRGRLRTTDVAARYGGEEFCVLAPETDLGHAGELAEGLRECVAAEVFAVPGGGEFRVTCSIGVAPLDGEARDVAGVFRLADAALYKAKTSGRNRVVLHGAGEA